MQPSIKKFKAENKVIVRNNDSDSDEEDSKNQTNSDSESSVDTKNRTLRVNNDVSDSDSETSKDTSDDAEESSPEQSAQSTNNDGELEKNIFAIIRIANWEKIILLRNICTSALRISNHHSPIGLV